MTRIIPVATFLFLLCWSTAATADPILFVTPSETEVTVGSTLDVTVSIAELTGEGVGAYDLSLFFDDSVLSFLDFQFDDFLDDGLPGTSIQGVFPSPGEVEVFELSLIFPLSQLGLSGFDLFTASFDVIDAGTSFLNLGNVVVSDLLGVELEVELRGASVTATDAVSVPEPGTAGLIALGLVGLMLSRRRLQS